MLGKMVLLLGLTFGGSLPTAPAATTATVPAAAMCQPPATAETLRDETATAVDCSPRGAGCEYSHECCSHICRKIRGGKSCG